VNKSQNRACIKPLGHVASAQTMNNVSILRSNIRICDTFSGGNTQIERI